MSLVRVQDCYCVNQDVSPVLLIDCCPVLFSKQQALLCIRLVNVIPEGLLLLSLEREDIIVCATAARGIDRKCTSKRDREHKCTGLHF